MGIIKTCMEYFSMNLDKKLYTLKYSPDTQSHLNPDKEQCKTCLSRNCTYICPAGVYEWSEENELKLILTAETDAPTIVNLTNHVYFNLDGEGSGTVLDHKLELNASQYLPTDETQIPLGKPEDVAGTPMDFVEAKPIGQDIQADFTALKIGKGYDHCFLIDGAMPGQLTPAAELWAAKSGRKVEILTTQPAVQLYTGNWLKGCPNGKTGHVFEDYEAVAIECQHTPDAPNQPDFPTTVLRPGEVYEEAIIWVFTA